MWYDLGTGIIYGLYDEPPESVFKCPRCIEFGKDLALLNEYYIRVDLISSIWFDKTALIKMEFFKMFDALLNLYPTFSNFYEKMANVVTNKSILKVLDI